MDQRKSLLTCKCTDHSSVGGFVVTVIEGGRRDGLHVDAFLQRAAVPAWLTAVDNMFMSVDRHMRSYEPAGLCGTRAHVQSSSSAALDSRVGLHAVC
jgi:hypothetical protein